MKLPPEAEHELTSKVWRLFTKWHPLSSTDVLNKHSKTPNKLFEQNRPFNFIDTSQIKGKLQIASNYITSVWGYGSQWYLNIWIVQDSIYRNEYKDTQIPSQFVILNVCLWTFFSISKFLGLFIEVARMKIVTKVQTVSLMRQDPTCWTPQLPRRKYNSRKRYDSLETYLIIEVRAKQSSAIS